MRHHGNCSGSEGSGFRSQGSGERDGRISTVGRSDRRWPQSVVREDAETYDANPSGFPEPRPLYRRHSKFPMKPAKAKRVRPQERASRAHSSRKPILLVAIAAVVALAAAYLYWGGRMPSPPGPGAAHSPAASAAPKVDLQRLVGDWVRPDGGYVISIRRIAPDGRAEVAYLNPRPINVSRAEASAAGDTAKLFIELRDAGYPGSTYELIYDPRSDLLTGVYFQAAMGQRFDVVFVRKK